MKILDFATEIEGLNYMWDIILKQYAEQNLIYYVEDIMIDERFRMIRNVARDIKVDLWRKR